MHGKCPKCENVVTQARLEHLNVSDGRMVVKAFSAACPHCNTILGVLVDPRPADQAFERIERAVGVK